MCFIHLHFARESFYRASNINLIITSHLPFSTLHPVGSAYVIYSNNWLGVAQYKKMMLRLLVFVKFAA